MIGAILAVLFVKVLNLMVIPIAITAIMLTILMAFIVFLSYFIISIPREYLEHGRFFISRFIGQSMSQLLSSRFF